MCQHVLGVVARRMEQGGLELHPGKTPEFREELAAASPRLSTDEVPDGCPNAGGRLHEGTNCIWTDVARCRETQDPT
jgi:hypothetical protein